MTELSSNKCAFITEQFCADLAFYGHEQRKKWIWEEVSGCALGYYLPDGARVPSRAGCEHRIFDPMRFQCAADGRYNAGSINVFDVPDFGGDGSGVDPGEGRYMMASERLTL